MKTNLLLIIFLFVLKTTYCQNSNLFSELNSSALSTGILYDKELHFVNWEKYNGVFDTLADYSTLSQLYAEIYNSFLQASASLPGIFVLDKQIQDIKDRTGLIPLIFINYRHNQIKTNAIQNTSATFFLTLARANLENDTKVLL